MVVFGATGYTGRLVAERLVARGVRPVLAGRSADRLAALAESLDGLEWRVADASRQSSVYGAVGDGEVLVSTVGPFTRWGATAVRAALAAGAIYLDTTGEPPFVRRVFEEFDGPARRAGAALLPAMGYDYVPGVLAGALALSAAGARAVRVDIGYWVFGFRGVSAGTASSAVEVALGPNAAYRDGAVRVVRPAERVRTFAVRGRDRAAISVGGTEHYALPAAFPALREVNAYLGSFGPLAPALQVGSLALTAAAAVPGVRTALHGVGERIAARLPAPSGDPARGTSRIVAEAYDAADARLARVDLEGPGPYALTAGLVAWAAERAARVGVEGRGALGPVGAFGLAALEAGAAEAGLVRAVNGGQ